MPALTLDYHRTYLVRVQKTIVTERTIPVAGKNLQNARKEAERIVSDDFYLGDSIPEVVISSKGKVVGRPKFDGYTGSGWVRPSTKVE